MYISWLSKLAKLDDEFEFQNKLPEDPMRGTVFSRLRVGGTTLDRNSIVSVRESGVKNIWVSIIDFEVEAKLRHDMVRNFQLAVMSTNINLRICFFFRSCLACCKPSYKGNGTMQCVREPKEAFREEPFSLEVQRIVRHPNSSPVVV